MQGWRDAQEDAFLATEIPGMPDHVCFAVFDGHGGRRWSTAAARTLDEGPATSTSFWTISHTFSGPFQHYTSTHAPRDLLELLPMLIAC